MKRRHFVTKASLAGAAGALLTGCGAESGETGGAAAVVTRPRVSWRLTSSFPRSLDTIFGAAEVMAKKGFRAYRWTVQHTRFSSWRTRPVQSSLGNRAARHGSNGPYGQLLFHRIEPGTRVRLHGAFWAKLPPIQRVDVLRRRP